jgi:hypothetical protein
LLGWALDTKTMNHSLSSFCTINLRRGLRIVLNSSRSCTFWTYERQYYCLKNRIRNSSM